MRIPAVHAASDTASAGSAPSLIGSSPFPVAESSAIATSADPTETTEVVVGGSLAAGSGPTVVVAALVLLTWVLVGVTTARAMGRRGHDARALGAVGVLLGPLVIPYALRVANRREHRVEAQLVRRGSRGAGTTDVLVALVGVGDDVADAFGIIDALGERLGRVTVATAVPYDGLEGGAWNDADARSVLQLEVAAALLSTRCDADTVVVGGPRERVLAAYAGAARFDLLVLCGDPSYWTSITSYPQVRSFAVAVPRDRRPSSPPGTNSP